MPSPGQKSGSKTVVIRPGSRLENRAFLMEGAADSVQLLACGRLTMRLLIMLSLVMLLPQPLSAHPGGLAGDGCYNNRKNGGRHCHSGKASSPERPKALRAFSGGGGAFANCTAAKAAGAAPVRRGEPGYGSHLDRDNDGVGCE